jgi:hypothetical protein
VALIGVWLAGETTSGRAARRWLAPVLGHREWAYGIVVTFLLLVVWWGPTAQTRRAPQMIVALILLLIATEALHRLTVREFPTEAAVTPHAAWSAYWSGRRGRAQQDKSLEELDRLARLRESGVLTDAEVAAEKARIQGTTGSSPTPG